LKKAKTLPQLKKYADIVFTAYIRKRDEDQPCISCNEFKPNKQAGHYYAKKGYDGLRYDEYNTNGECEYDNCFNESHLIGYGFNLLDRIGPERLVQLHDRATDYKINGYKFTRTELEGIIKTYTEKIKQL
jgi:hypothetical protein